MNRVVLFLVLLAVIILFGVLSYEVLSAFILPMFLAMLLVVIFRPLFDYFLTVCRGRVRMAAGLTTASVLLIVLLPTIWVGYRAARETLRLTHELTPDRVTGQVESMLQGIESMLPKALQSDEGLRQIVDFDYKRLLQERWQSLAGQAAQIIGSVVQMLIMLTIMAISLYYFLADGPELLRTFSSLFPMKEQYKQQLLREFGNLTRAVILAMLAAALGQGLLAGVGYYFADLDNVFLLIVLTSVFAMVPFVGSTLVWAPCVLWLYFSAERTGAAIGLGLYCIVVVSLADNIVKPMVLHGKSNLHPLLALLSVLGGAQALGPIGILLGPMIVAFFQTLLVMLRNELAITEGRPAQETPLVSG